MKMVITKIITVLPLIILNVSGHQVNVPLCFEINQDLNQLEQDDPGLIKYVQNYLVTPPPVIRNEVTEVLL